jgi:hypothetical protein
MAETLALLDEMVSEQGGWCARESASGDEVCVVDADAVDGEVEL